MFNRKKAILLIHGFIGGIYDYEYLPNELEIIKNFDVFTFTLPAHEKLIVSNVKYQDWIKEAENRIKFLINNNYKEIYIIGHSMGGVIASYLASTYTQIKKLVLVAPAFRYFYFEDGKVNIKGFNKSLSNFNEILKENGKENIIERIAKTPINTMIEFTKLVNQYQECVKRIECPILIIHGTNDNIVPKESTDYVYNNVLSKTNNYYIIDKVNHDCFTNKRNDETKEIIIGFLKKKPNNKKEILNI